MYSGATGSNDFSEAIKQYRADAHRHIEDTKILAISHRKSRLHRIAQGCALAMQARCFIEKMIADAVRSCKICYCHRPG
jgi:hypothetical protein